MTARIINRNDYKYLTDAREKLSEMARAVIPQAHADEFVQLVEKFIDAKIAFERDAQY